MRRRYQATMASLFLVLILVALAYAGLGATRAASVLLSGLTLAALYFLLAAGLSLIFGLMDVLNFAHGVIFMIGAYIGYNTLGNPRLLFNTLPLLMALIAGTLAGMAYGWPLRRWEARTRQALAATAAGSDRRETAATLLSRLSPSVVLALAAVALAVWGAQGFPLNLLVAFEPTATGGAIPTAAAQEPLSLMAIRLLKMAAAGILLGPLVVRETETGRHPVTLRHVLTAIGLAGSGVLILLGRDLLEGFVLSLSVDLRFLLALVTGAAVGGLLGALIERTLIRPFYGRPVTQIVLTLGLMFMGMELVKSVWGREGHPPMAMPSFFAQSCRSENLVAWLVERCSSVNVLGRAFPTYRLFIIAIGILILAAVGLLLRYSRLGMVIRAGVQDSDMVEALGINVRRVFTLVFALGSALAALGGVVAAPFVGVYPEMGGTFQLQAFIAVVIGGMGSYPGTAVGALLLGLARAFGDALVTSGITLPGAAQAFQASPALARASTVLIMAIVLLVRPAGIFGQKE